MKKLVAFALLATALVVGSADRTYGISVTTESPTPNIIGGDPGADFSGPEHVERVYLRASYP